MKKLTWTLVLPLTIISLATITKWWYVQPVDAPNTMMVGFPLAFAADGWHTSMSFQIFVIEFLVDFLIYFSFWLLLIFTVNHYFRKIRVPKVLMILIFIIAGLIMGIAVIIVRMPEQIVTAKRDWDRRVIITGFKFVWTSRNEFDSIIEVK